MNENVLVLRTRGILLICEEKMIKLINKLIKKIKIFFKVKIGQWDGNCVPGRTELD